MKQCAIVVLLFIAIYLVYRLFAICFFPCMCDMSETSDAHLSLSEIISFLLAIFTLCITYCEYNNHVKKRQAEVLSEYNHRYCENEDFKKIIKELIEYEDNAITKEDFLGEINNIEVVYQREMFMRFFEELQIQIEEKNLDKEQTFILFRWYASVVNKIGTSFVSDYDKEKCWETFKKFVEMKF